MVCIPLCFPPKIFDITTKACKDNTVKNCIKYSTTTNGSMTCVACATGFALGKLNGSVDFQCVQCSISCAQCKFALDNTNQYQEYCGQCADGYVFDSTGKCVAKDATTVPSVCAPTTFPLPKCTTCVFKGTSPVCTACETGFRLSGFGTCIKDCTDATNPYNFNYYDESTQSCGSCAPSNCL